MDANRRYSDEPEPSWYAGQQAPYDSGVFRLPDPRPVPEHPADSPPPASIPTYPTPPIRGPEYPTVSAPPEADLAPEPDGPRRPRSTVVVAVAAAILMIPVAFLLVQVTFVDEPAPRAVVPAVLLAIGVLVTAAGLAGLTASDPIDRESWRRPPVAYLPIGLFLLVIAGLTAG